MFKGTVCKVLFVLWLPSREFTNSATSQAPIRPVRFCTSRKINNTFSFQFQENSSSACASSSSSSSSDFLQRSSAKRKFDDGASDSPSIIGGGNGDGALSLDGKGDVKKVKRPNLC